MHILHATDFSHGGDAAFDHALAIAISLRAGLTLLHVGDVGPDGADWSRYPGVRPRLVAWGRLAAGADKADVARELGVRVRKSARDGGDPARAILHAAQTGGADLVTLASRGPDGAPTLLHRSVSRPVAGGAVAPTLVVPEGAQGFVSARDGALHLGRILIAVDRAPDPRRAIGRAAALLPAIAAAGAEVELFHVGPEAEAPAIPDDILPEVRLRRLSRPGDPAAEIARRGDEIAADLIVLATEGRHGLLDALRGSVTERVIARAGRPVLACPAL